MRRWLTARVTLGLLLASAPATPQAQSPTAPAWAVESVAPGVTLVRLEAQSLVGEQEGRVAVAALRVDPSLARLELVVARDGLPAREPVAAMAVRHQAIAAVNAGFFTPDGRPAGLLRLDRQGVFHPPDLPRAAVGVQECCGPVPLLVDRVATTLSSALAWGQMWPFAWFQPGLGESPLAWLRARWAVGGAGLLRHEGRVVEDWEEERLGRGFASDRHPRTLAGVDWAGDAWLIVVDGRRPGHSIGVTLAGLARLAAALGLRDAVNLDGGGSTTMVVRGAVVNWPSDPTGPRPVTDAILVLPRDH